jgi:hypothetical protein
LQVFQITTMASTDKTYVKMLLLEFIR